MINFDVRISEIICETKSLQNLGFSVPVKAIEMQLYEKKLSRDSMEIKVYLYYFVVLILLSLVILN